VPNTEIVLPNQISKRQTFKFLYTFSFYLLESGKVLALFNPLKISEMTELVSAD
jgi:hypothetical protein